MNGNAVIIFDRTIQGEMNVPETLGKILYEEFMNKLGRPLTAEEAESSQMGGGEPYRRTGRAEIEGDYIILSLADINWMNPLLLPSVNDTEYRKHHRQE